MLFYLTYTYFSTRNISGDVAMWELEVNFFKFDSEIF